MPFVCECGSEDFYTHNDEEVVVYINGDGEEYENGDIVDGYRTHNFPVRCCECEKEYSQIPPKNAEGEWIESCKRSYLNNASMCPICSSTDVSGDSLEADGTHVYQNISCGNCNAMWTDIYYLRGVEINEYPSDMVPQEDIPSSEGEIPNPNDAFKEQDTSF